MRQSNCLVYFLGILILLFSCKKDNPDNNKKENETKKPPKVATALIKASIGGTLETSDSIKMIIPSGALPGDATVSVGITGNEPEKVPNQNLTVIGRPFTVVIPLKTLNNTITITIPKPRNFIDTLQTAVFAYNGEAYYPMYYTINGDNLKIFVDVTTWKINEYSTQTRSVVGTDKGELVIAVVKMLLAPPSDSELGLRKVTIINNKFVFSSPQGGENKKVLLLVHGLMSSSSSCWTNFLKEFIAQSSSGYKDIWTYGYNTSKGIEDNGFELSKALKASKAKIDIIGHSMGGLVARTAIENGGCSEFVEHLVTLGTPHAGSPTALVNSFLGAMVAANGVLEDFDFSDFYSYNNATQGVQDLLGSSAYINKIKNQRAPIPYYTIAATHPLSLIANDGLVYKESATNVVGAIHPDVIQIWAFIPHTAMTDNVTVIKTVADYLNANSPDFISFNGTYRGNYQQYYTFPKGTIRKNYDLSNPGDVSIVVDNKGNIVGIGHPYVVLSYGMGSKAFPYWNYKPVHSGTISANGSFKGKNEVVNTYQYHNRTTYYTGKIVGNTMYVEISVKVYHRFVAKFTTKFEA